MHAIAINASPRKNHNTATILKHALDGAASAGATVETIHLYDLNYKGCTSCFACKRKDDKNPGHCAMKDDLTPILEKIRDADVLLLGSPIYIWDVTGEMRSFMERLIFPNLSYENLNPSSKKLQSAFFFTMNMPKDAAQIYTGVFEANTKIFERAFAGRAEILAVYDTYQFNDYSKYAAARFDESHKAKVKAEQFPKDCAAAFEIGKKLAQKK
ncbi:flavodoxin family protein [Methanolapillus millepedarum]|uniref:NADPH-dependent FMN reductase-like domain-containing protein n=1 Tax=Methanolapillus millepedarum TaxID=3028296 RepID=A0AA96V419_9EURY|nr:hypothetical protein MsAc7_01250 [Methanosarcinaceae archaeon Ac7]